MPAFLLKTEPSEYSYGDLVRDGRTAWTGVTNAAALIHIRSMRKGDEAFIYHTGGEKQIVGLARIVTDPCADARKPGTTPEGKPKFAVVDIEPVREVKTPVTLTTIKGDPRFKDFALVRISRLSVMPVPPAMAAALKKLAGV
ncbi:MAG: EVE domain-containing protein [Phycisphaerales bacterium]|nr:EVE domain-containing protein [Phycisphaerales bacterium]